MQPGRIDTGYVAHTLGWPLGSDIYGGGWIYGMRDNRVSVGMVVGLEYTIRFLIRTKHFRNSRPIRLSSAFSKAASSFATARKRCLTAAGIRCRGLTSTAA